MAEQVGSAGRRNHDEPDDAEPVAHLTYEDIPDDDTTPLWEALMDNRPELVKSLVAAGADPWLPVLCGWSPGRLSLAGPTPGLFAVPEGERGLNAAEHAAVLEAKRLRAVLGDPDRTCLGLACVRGIDAAEAIRRLEATPMHGSRLQALPEDLWAGHSTEDQAWMVGVTTVPGGCIVTQPWGVAPQAPGVQERLSAGTVCYGLFVNPKSGEQGTITRDGDLVAWGLYPGGGPTPHDTRTPDDVLLAYLHRGNAVAHACAWAGLRPTDARAVDGPPEVWVELPRRDYWEH
ncbi:DUF6461 domain-containing protein [Streptomyces sp. I05A-00742]|uniref:DUF6461 domain-containing protein n=1 Tax=Streptomyces sp. I05A-00742 TaxID=2732853 RepID=UPI0020171E89|nr:DUF6461 domain-containing protein [Streptomyces sp. I05A-00742]